MSNSWLFWSLLSALFAGATAVLAKVGVTGVDSNLATAIRTTVILVFAWAIALVTSRPGALATLGSRTWVFLALSGIATGLSWMCYFRALQRGPTSLVAAVDKVSVILVPILAALWLSERLGMREWAAILMIGGGVLVMVWRV